MSDTRFVGDEYELHGLLADAGLRSAPPELHLTAIRRAGLDAWTLRVAAERRRKTLRRSLALAAGLALALSAAWWIRRVAPRTPAPELARLELAVGDLRVASPRGDALVAGARLETAGGAALRLAGGAELRLDARSSVELLERARVGLVRGALYVDGDPSAENVEVVTPLGTVRELGTQFEVRLASRPSPTLVVAVRDGAVALGEERVAAGERAVLVAGEPLRREPIVAWDPAWSWARDLARPRLGERANLVALLRWSCRESGLRLVFAPPELAARAATIEVHGPLADLPPADAAAAALLGAGFAHRIAQGELVVSESPASAARAPE